MIPSIMAGWDGIELQSMTIGLAVLCLVFVIFLQRRKGKLPPGPKGLPLFGNLHQLDAKDMLKSLKELSNKYGPVFTIYLGPQPNVVLYGYKAVKEALVEQADVFSGRGDFPIVSEFTKGNAGFYNAVNSSSLLSLFLLDNLFKHVTITANNNGIAFSNGEKWKVLRSFALATLRNFGMGKRSIEERIQEEAQFMVEEFRNTNQKPFNPTFFLSRAVSNVICSIVFGHRFEYKDKKFLSVLQVFNENFQLMSTAWGMFYNIFPGIMKHLPGPHQCIFKNFEKLKSFVLEKVKEHEKTFQPECPRDFIDCFLAKIQKEKDDPLSSFNTETIAMTTLNLFFGGTETVSTTLRYGILILMKYPDITEKVHQEIDKVIGRNRCPTVEDRSKMPYTDAVVHEIQRFTSIIPLNIPHSVIRDTHFRGYHLPKGTNVIAVLSSVHNDPEKFKEPETFNPENFLDENNGFKTNDAFMPFSIGKRICLGEGLARMEIFLFLTTFLQNFDFKPTVPRNEIDLTPSLSGVGNLPCDYQLCAVPR